MIGDVKGYCIIKSDCIDDLFIGLDKVIQKNAYDEVIDNIKNSVPLRIIDVAVNGSGFMCLSPKANCIIDVRNMRAVLSHFLCCEYCGVLLPKEYEKCDMVTKTLHASKRLNRKGGYGDIVRKMVIVASLYKGEFTDDFLFTSIV